MAVFDQTAGARRSLRGTGSTPTVRHSRFGLSFAESAPPYSAVPLRALKLLTRPRTWWVLFGCWAAGIFALSSLSTLPPSPISPDFLEIDKILHAAAYTIGALFLTAALRLQLPRSALRIAALSLYLMLLFGLIDEIHQGFVPNRSGLDPGDLLADIIGSLVGTAFVLLLYAGPRTHPTDR